MPGQFRVKFKNFTTMDFSTAKKVVIPKPKPHSSFEEPILRGAIDVISNLSSRKSMWKSLLGVAEPPRASMSISGLIPCVTIRSPSPDFTCAVGAGVTAGAGVTSATSAGVYFWNKSPSGEIGFFGSISVGVVTNAGISFGDSLALLFGKPSDVLAGDSITVSVEIGIDVITFSGSVILTAPPAGLWPPAIGPTYKPEVIGIAFGLSAGISALPADIAVMPGKTWIKPVTP